MPNSPTKLFPAASTLAGLGNRSVPRQTKAMPPEICPACGTEVPPRAKACPECGSDESTGWSEKAHADGLGLPDESFNYNEFVEREFRPARRQPVRPWYWTATAVLLLALMVGMIVRTFFR